MKVRIFLILLSISAEFVHSTHLTRQRPSFVTKSQNLIVEKNAAVVLNCTIQDLGSYSAVWRYLNHDITISVNETIIAANKDHYKILRPPAPDENKTTKTYSNWFLEIKNVDVGDIGYYSCEVKDVPGLLQVSGIRLQNVAMPPLPKNVVQKTNYTDCCQKDNVSKACLPMCSPHSFDSQTFHYELCHKNLTAILRCGADGRNHIPCCRQRMIPDHCLDLCMNEVNFTAFTTHMAVGCYDRMKDITECFAEGQVALPGPPVQVHANTVTKTSLFVGWSAPKFNSDLVTGYIVFYAEKGDEHFTATPVIQELYHVLTGLKENTWYMVYVQALSKHGSSLPSYEIDAFVKDVTVVDGGKMVTDCCNNQGVSTTCLPILCGGRKTDMDSNQMMNCIGDFKKSLTCYSGGRDHTPCCQSKNVHTSCLDFCRGSTSPTLDIDHLMCVSFMNDISNCLMEGLSLLPGPPEDISVADVTTKSARVFWKEPRKSNHPERVMQYVVMYKPKLNNMAPMKVLVDKKTFNATLKNLERGMLYEVYVLGANSAGTGPPSSSANFKAYQAEPETGIVMPPAQKAPYNATACCEDKKLDPKCLPLCSFQVDAKVIKSVPSFCTSDSSATKTILTCGTDSRDHTPCCRRETLPDKCLPLCAVTKSTVLDDSHKECFTYITTIYKCYEEGNALIPMPPQDITIKDVGAHTMFVSWKPPTKAPEGVTYYMVEYQKDGDKVWMHENVTSKEYKLQNLSPDTRYQIRVRSGNVYGTSLVPNEYPSRQTNAEASGGGGVTTTTSPPPDLTNYTSSISACCDKSSVSTECKPLCTAAKLGSMLKCKNDFNKIISCTADQRNHRDCCMRNAVPSFCLKYCEGKSADQLTAVACATHLQQIRSCFFQGYNRLPSSPREFTVTSVMVDSIGSAWKDPAITHGNSVVNMHYDVKGQYVNEIKENVTSPYVLGSLTPDTLYDLYTVSVNKFGSSAPSTSFSVYTYEKSSDAVKITVSYSPKGFIREGQDVTFKCFASATSTGTQTIEWWKAGKKVSSVSEYKRTNVKKEDRGIYTCKVNNNNEAPKQKNIYLRMQYQPTVTVPKPSLDVPPYQQLDANMTCYFKGYPDKLIWYKNGYDMSGRTYTTVKTIRHDDTGITEFNLVVMHIINADYATYSCVGSTKGIGTATGYIHLYDNTTTTPELTPASKVHNVTDCCVQKGVKPKCQVACDFDVDLTAMKNVLVDCVKDLSNILLCGADGKDHTTCCNTNHVPRKCQPFCAGVLPKLSMDDLVYCLGFSSTVIDCMEMGSVLIPSAPEKVYGDSGEGYIDVHWDRPKKNSNFVQRYEIYYRTSSGGSERRVTVFRWRSKVRLENLSSGTEYTIYVLAVNHHGKSGYSNTVIISTRGPPNPPQQLICVPTNNNLRLSWNSPLGAIRYYTFHVYYRADEVSDKYTSYETSDFNMLLDELLAGRAYTIYVVAVNHVGESRPSNKCHVYAPGNAPSTTDKTDKTATRTNIGLGIGLGVVLVILLIAAGILGYHLWKKRGQQAGKKPTVSFENPAYKPRTDNPDGTGGGGIQISGLPNQEEQPIQTFGPPASAVPGPQSAAGANGGDTVIGNPYAESSLSTGPADNDLGVVVGQLDVNRLDPNQVKVEINYDTGISES